MAEAASRKTYIPQGVRAKLSPTENPTVNTRNERMFREATQFSQELLRVEKDIRTIKAANERFFVMVIETCCLPLPRVYEANESVANDKEVAFIGGANDRTQLSVVARDLSGRIEKEILLPMQHWQLAFETIKVAMKQLEDKRLEVDSRRKTDSKLLAGLEKRRAAVVKDRQHQGAASAAVGTGDISYELSSGKVLPSGAGIGRKTHNLFFAPPGLAFEKAQRQYQHKSAKLATARMIYETMEQEVFQQLSDLNRDAASLKSYIARTMLLLRDCFNTAIPALGPIDVAPAVIPAPPVAPLAAPPVGATVMSAAPAPAAAGTVTTITSYGSEGGVSLAGGVAAPAAPLPGAGGRTPVAVIPGPASVAASGPLSGSKGVESDISPAGYGAQEGALEAS